MKLLIITQVMDKNDPILGFFHRWVEEFAKNVDSIVVICLKEGVHSLPENVRVLSLGKEEGESRIKYLKRFYTYIWRERNKYDSVFVHMNQVYVLLGGLLWRLWGKKVSLWYTHKSVTVSLRIAEKIVHHIFTASKESFLLPSKKVVVTGHAIAIDEYAALSAPSDTDLFTVISVGRVSPAKNTDKIVKVIESIGAQGIIVGGEGTPEQEKYFMDVQAYVRNNNLEKRVTLVGPIAHNQIRSYLSKAHLFLNISDTGSADKAILEAMAAQVPVMSSNVAFKELLEPLGLYITNSGVREITSHIKRKKVEILEEREKLTKPLFEYMLKNNAMEVTIKSIINILT